MNNYWPWPRTTTVAHSSAATYLNLPFYPTPLAYRWNPENHEWMPYSPAAKRADQMTTTFFDKSKAQWSYT